VVCGTFASFLSAVEPVRTWTSADGRTLEARMLSSQPDSVTLMTTRGQTFILPFEKLSEEDVAYVKAGKARDAAPEGGGGWLEDFDAAKQIAAAGKKPILMLFTGSDWCPYCIKLEKNVLDTKAFETFADQELVLMMVDSPRKKSQKRSVKEANAQLKQAYGIKGFPTLVLVDAEGKTLSKFGYGGQSVEKFIEVMQGQMPKS
jgi:thioredoxin-related protein